MNIYLREFQNQGRVYFGFNFGAASVDAYALVTGAIEVTNFKKITKDLYTAVIIKRKLSADEMIIKVVILIIV